MGAGHPYVFSVGLPRMRFFSALYLGHISGLQPCLPLSVKAVEPQAECVLV